MSAPRAGPPGRERQHALNAQRTDLRLYPAEWEDIIEYPTFERLQARFGAQLVRDDEGLRLIRPGTGASPGVRYA
jgi:hypothetical protein